MSIDQTKRLCPACLKRHVTDWHHTVPRRKLSTQEQSDPAFQIGLCWQCHADFTSHHTKGGYRFYKKHRLLLSIKQRCNYDPRVIETLNALECGELQAEELTIQRGI